MKNKLILLSAILVIPALAFAQKKDKTALMKNEIDSVSYSLGVAIGNNLKSSGVKEFNDKLFVQAITEILANKETAIKPELTNNILQTYFMKLHNQKSSENLSTGRKFLEENKKKEGIITLPSGLQYKVINEGTGAIPTINDKVTCHYHGTLIDGKVFDSSEQRGKPAQFNVNGVISGWTEALQLMKVGSKWTLYIPSELAYGEQNIPGIEPNSVLIFNVELISIDKEEAPVNQ